MLDVVAALIQDEQGRLLACQRPPGKHLGGKWEFPGGKLEDGESPADALIREIREELGVTISPGECLTDVIHDYGRGPIRLIPFLCRITLGTPCPHEHSELRWCGAEELPSLDWAEADIPILREFLARDEK